MKMIKVSQCKKNLNFMPLHEWPESFPAFTWGEELLCNFSAEAESTAIDLESKEASLATILSDIYKTLSLAELSRIYQLHTRSKIFAKGEFELLLEKNSLRASESLTDLLLKLSETSIEFQKWTSDRKLGARELFILKSLESASSVKALLDQIASKAPSRQIGIQILENSIELFLMSHELSKLLSIEDESCEAWLSRLDRMRNPMLAAQTEAKQKALALLSWPKFISTRVIQSEASLVNEVRLQYRNLGELKRNIEALQKVHTELESQSPLVAQQ